MTDPYALRLYHWAPRDRRDSITKVGLLAGQVSPLGPVYHCDERGRFTDREYRAESVCFGTSPGAAWNYSFGVWRLSGAFDLYEVDVGGLDFEPRQWLDGVLVEARIAGGVEPARVRWIAERIEP